MLLQSTLASFGLFEVPGLKEERLSPAPPHRQFLRVPNTAVVYCPVGIKISYFSRVFKLLPYLSAKIQTHLTVQTASMSGIQVHVWVWRGG